MQPSEKITGRVVHRGTHRYRSDRPMLEVNSGHRGLESLPASTLSLCSLCHQRRILKGGGVQGVDRGRDRWPEGIGGLLENVNRALENNRGQQRYTTYSSSTIYDRQWNTIVARSVSQDRLRVIGGNYPAGYGSPRNEARRFFGPREVRLLAR